jgi:hypothetical protein
MKRAFAALLTLAVIAYQGAYGLEDYATLIVPFDLVGLRAEYHVIAWFNGHPDYETVEAFVYAEGRARAILTRPDGSQIDIFNYPEADITSGREWRAGSVEFALAANRRDATLRLTLPDGKVLALDYVGQGALSPAHAGLTDPGQHAPDGGLPTMYRQTSSVASDRSRLTVDGVAYPIPIDASISKPPFFTAYKAFLSEGYESLIVRTYAEKAATELTPASSLTYRTGNSENTVTLASGKGAVGAPKIRSILADTPLLSGATPAKGVPRGVTLSFEPALGDPRSVADGTTETSRFAITFAAGKAKAIVGTVTVARQGNRVTIRLLPERPTWAKTDRAIRYDLVLSDQSGGTLASARMDRPAAKTEASMAGETSAN